MSRTGEAPQPGRARPADDCGTHAEAVRDAGADRRPEFHARRPYHPARGAGYKRFTDAGGAEIYTYVRNYAEFAGEEVPAGKSCSLTGILQYDDAGKGRYLLKIRDENDCMY